MEVPLYACGIPRHPRVTAQLSHVAGCPDPRCKRAAQQHLKLALALTVALTPPEPEDIAAIGGEDPHGA